MCTTSTTTRPAIERIRHYAALDISAQMLELFDDAELDRLIFTRWRFELIRVTRRNRRMRVLHTTGVRRAPATTTS